MIILTFAGFIVTFLGGAVVGGLTVLAIQKKRRQTKN